MEFVTFEIDLNQFLNFNSPKAQALMIALCSITLIGGYYILQNKVNTYNTLLTENNTLLTSLSSLNSQISSLTTTRQELNNTEEELNVLQHQALLQTNDNWLSIISNLAQKSNVTLTQLLVQKTKKEYLYTTIPLKIALVGKFTEIQAFLLALSNTKPIVLLDALNIKTSKNTSSVLQVQIKLKFLHKIDYASE